MLRHYLTMTIAVLKRRPFYTAISLFGISFTLLVLMVVTAMADHTLAPMAPESRQARMLGVHSARMYGPDTAWSSNGGYLLFDKYARNLPGAEALTIFSGFQTVSTYLGDQRITSNLKRTDGAFWRVFDFTFLEGGPYGQGDVDDARFLAVITRATREKIFNGAAGARQDVRGRRPVLPRRRRRRERVGHPDGPLRRLLRADDDRQDRRLQARDHGRFQRRGAGADHRRSAEDPRGVQRQGGADRAAGQEPTRRWWRRSRRNTTASRASRRSPTAPAPDRQGPKLTLFLVIAGLLFVTLPTVNLVNVNISRILERASEIGVRKAFGAPTRTLVAQFVVENVILTLIGGAIGLVLSALVLRALNQSGFIAHSAFIINARVFAYAVLLAFGFGLISGRLPRVADGPAPSRRGAQGRTLTMTRHLVRLIWNRKRQNLLLTLEILCSFLVVFAVDPGRAQLRHQRAQDARLRRRPRVVRGRRPAAHGARRTARRAPPPRRRGRASATPSSACWPPPASCRRSRSHRSPSPRPTSTHPGRAVSTLADGRKIDYLYNRVGDDFTRVFSMPILAGRGFTREDDAAGVDPVLINVEMAQKVFGDANPIGRIIPERPIRTPGSGQPIRRASRNASPASSRSSGSTASTRCRSPC